MTVCDREALATKQLGEVPDTLPGPWDRNFPGVIEGFIHNENMRAVAFGSTVTIAIEATNSIIGFKKRRKSHCAS